MPSIIFFLLLHNDHLYRWAFFQPISNYVIIIKYLVSSYYLYLLVIDYIHISTEINPHWIIPESPHKKWIRFARVSDTSLKCPVDCFESSGFFLSSCTLSIHSQSINANFPCSRLALDNLHEFSTQSPPERSPDCLLLPWTFLTEQIPFISNLFFHSHVCHTPISPCSHLRVGYFT